MKLNIANDLKNLWPLPLIFYKPNHTTRKTPTDKSDSLKFDIKTKPGESDSDIVAIYVPLFQTGSTEDLLKFVTILNKVIKGQDISKGPLKYEMTRNLVIGESLQVFKQKTWDHGTKTNTNYKLVMKYLIIHFFPPKALHPQKRYQRRGIYKPHGTKIRDFI